VEFFFIISGYLLVKSALKNYNENIEDKNIGLAILEFILKK